MRTLLALLLMACGCQVECDIRDLCPPRCVRWQLMPLPLGDGIVTWSQQCIEQQVDFACEARKNARQAAKERKTNGLP